LFIQHLFGHICGAKETAVAGSSIDFPIESLAILMLFFAIAKYLSLLFVFAYLQKYLFCICFRFVFAANCLHGIQQIVGI